MKEKIFVFIIGLLVGAILATGGFYIYQKNNKAEVVSGNSSSENQTKEFDGQGDMEPPELPNGEMPQKPDGEEPPAKPDDNNSSESNSTTEKTKKNGDSKTKKTENTVTTEE